MTLYLKSFKQKYKKEYQNHKKTVKNTKKIIKITKESVKNTNVRLLTSCIDGGKKSYKY